MDNLNNVLYRDSSLRSHLMFLCVTSLKKKYQWQYAE